MESPERLTAKAITDESLSSLREATIDFCKRSESPGKAMNTWAYILRVLNSQENADLWWTRQGNKVTGFSLIRCYQDFDGEWTAYVLWGWSTSGEAKRHFKKIVDDYFHKGVNRIQFTTRRNAKAFQRWAGKPWGDVGYLFELRRDHYGK